MKDLYKGWKKEEGSERRIGRKGNKLEKKMEEWWKELKNEMKKREWK